MKIVSFYFEKKLRIQSKNKELFIRDQFSQIVVKTPHSQGSVSLLEAKAQNILPPISYKTNFEVPWLLSERVLFMAPTKRRLSLKDWRSHFFEKNPTSFKNLFSGLTSHHVTSRHGIKKQQRYKNYFFLLYVKCFCLFSFCSKTSQDSQSYWIL